jgi:hypothetical protein
MELAKQSDSLEKEVEKLYKAWMDLDCRNMEIKDSYSQSRILLRLEGLLYDKYDLDDPIPKEARKKIVRRCENLRKRIQTRFETENPKNAIEALEAFNLYLVNNCKLNSLKCSIQMYRQAILNH